MHQRLSYRINANIRSGEFDKDLNCFNKDIVVDYSVIDMNGNSSYHNRGIAYAFPVDYENAISDLNKPIEFEPDDFFEYYLREGMQNISQEN